MLINLLPVFYLKSIEVQDIQGGFDIEVDKLKAATDDMFAQMFVDTATWGLDYWEKYLAIPVDLTKPYDFRRTRIKSKLRGQGTTTVNLIKNVSESFSNGTVDVIENNSDYSVTIKFVSVLGIPPNISDLQSAIEDIIPAHLSFSFAYTYNTYNDLKIHTYSSLSTYTYEGLRTHKF